MLVVKICSQCADKHKQNIELICRCHIEQSIILILIYRSQLVGIDPIYISAWKNNEVAKQLLQIGNVKNIPALVDIFYTYVKTDLTTGNLVWLGNEALNIGTENIHFATLPGDGSGYYNKQSVYVLDAQATCDLVNEALNPYNEALTLEDMDILVP